MPFNLSVAQAAEQVDTVPGVRAVRDLQLPPGRGRMFNGALPMIYRRRLFQALRPCLALLEFG